jgi:hypothetical protein
MLDQAARGLSSYRASCIGSPPPHRPLAPPGPRHAPNMGLHVWLITSKHTDPDLPGLRGRSLSVPPSRDFLSPPETHISSTFGWNRRFMKPMDGDLNG